MSAQAARTDARETAPVADSSVRRERVVIMGFLSSQRVGSVGGAGDPETMVGGGPIGAG